MRVRLQPSFALGLRRSIRVLLLLPSQRSVLCGQTLCEQSAERLTQNTSYDLAVRGLSSCANPLRASMWFLLALQDPSDRRLAVVTGMAHDLSQPALEVVVRVGKRLHEPWTGSMPYWAN